MEKELIMFEAMKAIVSAYMQYERDGATDESLRGLAAGLDAATHLIQQNYQSIIDTLIAIRRDELKGRLLGTIDQFRLLHVFSRTQREVFQRDCAYLTAELTALASSRTNYNVYLYPYDFITMLATLAPIHAFANRCLGIQEVRYIFDRPYKLCLEYLKAPYDDGQASCGDYGLWCDPAFPIERGDTGDQFRTWVDQRLHPFTRLLAEGSWQMRPSDIGAGSLHFPSVNGKPIPTFFHPNQGENMGELRATVSGKPQFRELEQIRDKLKEALANLPVLDTESEIVYSRGEPARECPRPPSPRTIEAYCRAGLISWSNSNECDNSEKKRARPVEDPQMSNPVPTKTVNLGK